MFLKNSYFDRSVLLMLIALEALLFYTFYYREIAWYPPQYFDQTAFLTESYRLQERIHEDGLGVLWMAMTRQGAPNGWLLHIEGALSGLFFGGGRLPQLLINFLAFATLQMVAFVTARAIWASRIYGYMVLGLILCLTTAWIPQGGLFDFRADLLAYCLYGIWACAILRSKLFLDRRWAIGCSLICAFLVANRFLTIVYLLGVSAGFAGVCVLVGLLWRTDGDLADRMRRRFFNICLSLCVLAVITAPMLILNWTAIHAYYIIGHIANVTGTPLAGEKYVRALAAGITDLTGHLLFYPRCILLDHLGSTFLLGSALAITTGLIARLLGRSQTPGVRRESRKDETFLLQIIFLVGAILGPIVVLTADISKSGTTGGIVGVPVALLVVTLTAAIAPKLREFESSPLCNFRATCSLLIFVLGLSSEFEHFSRHLPEYAQRRDLERLAELDKWLIDQASEHDWQNSTMFVDVISPWFHTEAITAAGYEQSRRFVEFRPMIGVGGLGGIMGVDKPEALCQLAMSDFVILTSLPKTGVYPFYERVARYWGDLKAWADENMIVARTVPFDSFTATVYYTSHRDCLWHFKRWVGH
jgi:hypothetical protein